MHTTEKLSITVPARYAQIIRAKVDSGSYASSSEVIREALRLWNDFESIREKRLEALRAAMDESLDDARPSIAAEEVFRRLEKDRPQT